MWVLLIALLVIVFVLVAFLYSIWREEDEENINLPQNEEEAKKTVKASFLDQKNFGTTLDKLDILNEDISSLKQEINKKIIWVDEFVNITLINIFSNWHLLVEGLPWLAKTKTIETLSQVMDMDFRRIQFTPDMMPGDITWVEIYNTKKQDFETKKWPVFANIVLADEINRTTPKVQSALLEAMQEKKVTISGNTFELPKPFFVLATQNPVEQEWTYTLPEAQVDRFMFKTKLDYPTPEQEKKILDMIETEDSISVQKIININRFFEIMKEIEQVQVSEDIKDYISRLVAATREPMNYVVYGASPRASIALQRASKTVAYFQGRDYVTFEDIQKISLPVLRHRIILSYDASVDWVTSEQILLDTLPRVSLE